MKTMRGRSSRVLLVAAMTTSAFAGATATAGAAETTEPTSTDCDPAEVQSVVPDLAVQASSCDSAPALVRSVLVNAMRSDDTLRVAEASVAKVFDVLHPELRECEIPDANDTVVVDTPEPAETVTGTDMTTVIGTVDHTVVEVAPEVVPEPDLVVEHTTEVTEVVTDAGSRSDNSVRSAVGGVAIEDTVAVDERAVAPEQMEVVGPATAATGGLPATGHDGSLLTVLGLAMIASGAATRFVARD